MMHLLGIGFIFVVSQKTVVKEKGLVDELIQSGPCSMLQLYELAVERIT